MNNKGFAITGIIYTLLILFLMILLTVITGLNSFQKLIINSTESFETTFKGNKLEKTQIVTINTTKVAPYTGKYIFKITNSTGTTLENCIAYLTKRTTIDINTITLSPIECNQNVSNIELTAVYSFEKES